METPSSHLVFLLDPPVLPKEPQVQLEGVLRTQEHKPTGYTAIRHLPRHLHGMNLFQIFFKTNACFHLISSESDFLCKTLSLFKLFKFKIIFCHFLLFSIQYMSYFPSVHSCNNAIS